MATVTKWTPFGVALNITATAGTVTRTEARKFTVKINASWETYWDNSKTDYGMTATAGGVTKTLNAEGTKSSGSNGSFTGTFSIDDNGGATKTITVTFKNFNTYHKDSATKTVSFNVSVPAWPSWKVTYNANGSGVTKVPTTQTKWKGQDIFISSTKPVRSGYDFLGWSTSKTATSADSKYDPGDRYTANAALALYAVWRRITYKITYNGNGNGSNVSNVPSAQTKNHGETLTLSATVPTRTDYTFKGWSTSASATTATYSAGGKYTQNTQATLYAVWESAYEKPTIKNVKIYRCDSEGNTKDDGTSVYVSFDWESFIDRPTVTVSWPSTSEIGASQVGVTTTGHSGTFSRIVGDGTINAELTYKFTIKVEDSKGSTTVTKTVSGMRLAIDFLAGGDGVAIGKPAEHSNLFEVNFPTRLNNGYEQVVLGPCDLNEVRTPNIYSCENVSNNTYTCGTEVMPFTSGTFLLEVYHGGSGGQTLQRITVCSKTQPRVYERWYYTEAWGEWYGVWKMADLTASGKFTNYYSDGSEAPKYRRVGNMVDIRGTVKPTSDIAYSTNYTTIFTLPSGYRPDTSVFTLCQGTEHCTWLLRVANNGNVGLARYRNGDTSVTANTSVWLPFHCTFLVD